jgi:hypothetical protein
MALAASPLAVTAAFVLETQIHIDREETMVRFIHTMKFAAAILLAAVALAGASTQSQAQTGTVYLKIVKAGFIIGGSGGHGTLVYNGVHYRLTAGGIGIGTIGIAEARLSGTAYHLHNPSDIVGTYEAAGAGLAIVGGPKVARLQNAKGVVLELHGVQLGLEATLGLGGMTISMH